MQPCSKLLYCPSQHTGSQDGFPELVWAVGPGLTGLQLHHVEGMDLAAVATLRWKYIFELVCPDAAASRSCPGLASLSLHGCGFDQPEEQADLVTSTQVSFAVVSHYMMPLHYPIRPGWVSARPDPSCVPSSPWPSCR